MTPEELEEARSRGEKIDHGPTPEGVTPEKLEEEREAQKPPPWWSDRRVLASGLGVAVAVGCAMAPPGWQQVCHALQQAIAVVTGAP